MHCLQDTFGDIPVQADKYWGAQTQRSDTPRAPCPLVTHWPAAGSMHGVALISLRDLCV